jgi:hypothetical protein
MTIAIEDFTSAVKAGMLWVGLCTFIICMFLEAILNAIKRGK